MSILTGVGLIVVDEQDRIFTNVELRNKPHFDKTAGMISIPFEGHERAKDHGCLKHTAVRAQVEELGSVIVPLEQITLIHPFTYRYSGGNEVDVSLTMIQAPTGFVPNPTDDDIEFHGWLTLDELAAMQPPTCRVEMEPVLQFLQKERHAMRVA